MEGKKSQGQDSNGQRGQLAISKLILYNSIMKYSLFPIFVLSFLIFTSCSSVTDSKSDSMIVEGILYSTKKPVSIEISDGKTSENIVLNSDLKSCEAVMISVKK